MYHSLDSREFKLILNPEIFRNLHEGITRIRKIINTKVEGLNGKFKHDADIKRKNRRTYYLDTINYKLRSKNFFLRVRENKGSDNYTITLKCRHPDRYISSAYDLSGPTAHKIKFEEDIIAPHISKFSMSAEFNTDQEPEIRNLHDLQKMFPGVRKYDLGKGRLEKVNKFEAEEISVELGKISYGDKNGKGFHNEIKTYLNFWYLPKKETIPLIVEFTYDYSSINKKKKETLEYLISDLESEVQKKRSILLSQGSTGIIWRNLLDKGLNENDIISVKMSLDKSEKNNLTVKSFDVSPSCTQAKSQNMIEANNEFNITSASISTNQFISKDLDRKLEKNKIHVNEHIDFLFDESFLSELE